MLGYELPHDQQLRLSYTKRMQRPDAGELNPFTDRSDQLNLVTGNPTLLSEYVHSVELGDQLSLAGGRSLSTTVFYRLEANTAQGFRQVVTDSLTGNLVTSTTRQNLGQETSCGLEVVAASPLTTFWTAAPNAKLTRTRGAGLSKGRCPRQGSFSPQRYQFPRALILRIIG